MLTNKTLVLACGALAQDLTNLFSKNNLQDFYELKCLPAKLHSTPHLIPQKVDDFLSNYHQKYKNIFVAYGDCGTYGKLDEVLKKYSAQRLAGEHCYEFFAGNENYKKLIDEEIGSFFVTDYLVKNFERLVLESLGLNKYPELFATYFGNYKRLVYLAQTENQDLIKKAKQIAQNFGFDFKLINVGIKGLNPIVEFSKFKKTKRESESV